MKLNPWLYKWHRRLALIAFIPVLIVSITGSLLVFKYEIDTLLMADKVNVANADLPRQSIDVLLKHVNNHIAPDYEAISWALFPDEIGRADVVFIRPALSTDSTSGHDDWKYLIIDPFSGKVLADPVPFDSYITDWLLQLHFNFLLKDIGIAMGLGIALLFAAIAITGFILYRNFWKAFFTLRWKSRLIVYFSDLHKMIGIVTSPVLLLLALTGGYWNAMELLEHAGEHKEQNHQIFYNTNLALQPLIEDSVSRIDGFKPTYIVLPYEEGLSIAIYGFYPNDFFLASDYSSVVTYDPFTGSHESTTKSADAAGLHQFVDSFRKIHFGHFAGLTSRIIWCIIGLAPLVLTITGLTLWYKRKQRRKA